MELCEKVWLTCEGVEGLASGAGAAEVVDGKLREYALQQVTRQVDQLQLVPGGLQQPKAPAHINDGQLFGMRPVPAAAAAPARRRSSVRRRRLGCARMQAG